MSVERLERARAKLREARLEALVVSDPVNIRYLSGYTGSNALLVLWAETAAELHTDSRYREQAAFEAPDVTTRISRNLPDAVAKRIAGARAGAETHHLSVEAWRALGSPDSAGRIIEALRVVKDAAELAAIERACQISTDALGALLEEGHLVGRKEREVATVLERLMVDMGAEDKAFDTILAAGSNAAVPHHRPTDRSIEADEVLKIDFGARVDGYHADCTRTFVTGTPDGFLREIHEVVRASQAAGVAALREGADLSAVWHAALDVLTASGWQKHFTTGLGHGVGLQIHEDPYFGRDTAGTLESRTVLTMEPGIYIPGRGGVRIEDTVVVADDGPRVLTLMTTELQEIG